jgi:hypothetical protein
VKINAIDVDYDRTASSAGWSVEEAKHFIDMVRSALVPVTRTFTVVEDATEQALAVTRIGIGPLNTVPHGRFWQIDFQVDDQWQHYQVLLNINGLRGARRAQVSGYTSVMTAGIRE